MAATVLSILKAPIFTRLEISAACLSKDTLTFSDFTFSLIRDGSEFLFQDSKFRVDQFIV
jgi:hypothetical protein